MYCVDIRTQNGLFSKSTGKGKQQKHVSSTEIARCNNLNSAWPLKNANYFLVYFVERLTISYQVCSVSTTSIGHQAKDVVSLTVLVCLIGQRTQRSQRFVVLLRKRACWILCLQISSPTTSPALCLPSLHKCFPGRGSDAEVVEACNCPTTFKETITGQRHTEQLTTYEYLTQLSKVIEKVVALRIMTHVSNQQMVECFQSAYRKNHSKETTLLYVTSAFKTAMDKTQGTILLLVDFSSAFDTINHNILIRRLRLRYGFVGKALYCVISYLKQTTQRVVIGDQSSSTTTLTTGVPLGSVLGPRLFSLYVQPVGDIIRARRLFFHQYADDLEVYAHFYLTHAALVAAISSDCA